VNGIENGMDKADKKKLRADNKKFKQALHKIDKLGRPENPVCDRRDWKQKRGEHIRSRWQ